MNGFKARMWEAFLRSQGVLVGILSLVLAFGLWQLAPSATIRIAWAAPIAVIMLLVIATLFTAALDAHRSAERALPRVIMSRPMPSEGQDTNLVFLLAPSNAFSYGVAVSFYFLEDGRFERLIGLGSVMNVQQDGHIQVNLSKVVGGAEDLVHNLASNDKSALEKLLVKPTIPGGVSLRGSPIDE